MGRALGINAIMAIAFESVYGTAPGSGYKKVPFVSTTFGKEQGLLASDLLGFGRDPLAPARDVINAGGDVVVPVDLRNFGYWLKALFGAPVTTGVAAAVGALTFSAQPLATSTITINGTVFTFVASGPTGNQILIGANLAATLTNIATALNGSAVPGVAAATYAVVGGNQISVTNDTLGAAGNAFTLAASASPASNATMSGATLTGGANAHVFSTASAALPSIASEVGHPEIPAYSMHKGYVANTLAMQLQRSGFINATVGFIGQDEAAPAGSTATGTPTEFDLVRFNQFQGAVKRAGAALGNVVSAQLNYSNTLESVEVIRDDGLIAGADPGLAVLGASIVVRHDSLTLFNQAIAGTPVDLVFALTISAMAKLEFAFAAAYLPVPKRPVSGPTGIQATYAVQAARPAPGTPMATVTLTNDVASY
jgi:hypothetical protein